MKAELSVLLGLVSHRMFPRGPKLTAGKKTPSRSLEFIWQLGFEVYCLGFGDKVEG